MCMRRALRVCWTGLCSQLTVGRLGEASGLDGMRRCEVGAHGLDHGHPHHQACRCSDRGRHEGGFGLIMYSFFSDFVEYYNNKKLCSSFWYRGQGFQPPFWKENKNVLFIFVSTSLSPLHCTWPKRHGSNHLLQSSTRSMAFSSNIPHGLSSDRNMKFRTCTK
jgi:hypothetical protein